MFKPKYHAFLFSSGMMDHFLSLALLITISHKNICRLGLFEWWIFWKEFLYGWLIMHYSEKKKNFTFEVVVVEAGSILKESVVLEDSINWNRQYPASGLIQTSYCKFLIIRFPKLKDLNELLIPVIYCKQSVGALKRKLWRKMQLSFLLARKYPGGFLVSRVIFSFLKHTWQLF